MISYETFSPEYTMGQGRDQLEDLSCASRTPDMIALAISTNTWEAVAINTQ